MELKRSTKRLMKRSQGKGDRVRPYDPKKFDENWDKIFKKEVTPEEQATILSKKLSDLGINKEDL